MTDRSLLDFLQRSPTPFHATANLSGMLAEAGFEALDEADAWQLRPGGRYYVVRNQSSLIAFTVGDGDPAERGIRMSGAHTDSPCLKVKPEPELRQHGTLQLGVEVYGGALLNPWFDRDLSLAGRVDFLAGDGGRRSTLIDFARPIAMIPSLAIHLDREANQNRSVNAQKDLPPILALLDSGTEAGFEQCLLEQLRRDGHGDAERILGHELSFYDTQPPATIGLSREFIASARLDNLLSCHACTRALTADPPAGSDFSLVVCNDHEEIGSATAYGAQGPFLESVLQRIVDACSQARGREAWERTIRRSVFLSVDNSHGIHPNYADRHDSNHGPQLNGGPVIKINANQRYASTSHLVALFRSLCHNARVPVQSFVVRSDMACGSTIGPITASGIGVDTLDIGVASFGMHSIRELAGSADADHLTRVLERYYQRGD